MGGICGVIQVTGPPRPVVDTGVLSAMTDAMTHRGPDARGIHVEDGVALGARRLSVVDLDAPAQPLRNERGDIWALQNGEIYNHAELRRDLVASGHTLLTSCDTEVLPHLYERDGLDLADSLVGMF